MKPSRILAVAALVLLGGASPPDNADKLAPPSVSQGVAALGVATPGVATTAPPVAPAGHTLTKADVDAWLDGYLPYVLRAGDIAGAEVAVVKDGKILTARGFGYADIAKHIPVDPNRTLFRPGSVSKLVTWTAVTQLVEQHKLDLDRDVNGYLNFIIPPFLGKPITLRQIMTHTAWFAERGKDISFYDRSNLQSLDAFLKAWVPERIYPAGSTPAYSNWATALAGYIVQRVSHKPFDDYVEQFIFDPLDMRNSTFRQPLPARLAPQMVAGYRRASTPAEPFELLGPTPAGALFSTAGDMARFMMAHLQDGELDGKRILEAMTAEMMHDSPLTHVDPMSLVPPLSRMELSFFETNINGHEVIGHLGDTEDFHTILHLFIRDSVGLYASFNSVGKDGAVSPLRAALFQDFANRYFPQAGQDGRVAPDVADRDARMMVVQWQGSRKSVGDFLTALSLLSQTAISVGPGGDLVVSGITDPGGVVRRWVEFAPFVWRDANGHDRLAARLVDGRVVRWSWEMLSPFEVFDHVPWWEASAWILPSFAVSLGVLLLGFVYWPVSALIRRHYRAPLALTGSRRLGYRLSRLLAGLVLAVITGWGATISTRRSGPCRSPAWLSSSPRCW